MGDRLYAGLKQAFGNHPHAGDIRGGKGLLAAVELVEDKATKANFSPDRKLAPRIQAEMMKRDVVTRVRPVSGAHPANGDTVFFAPPLVLTDKEVDRLVSVAHDSVKAVLGV
jgi:adenosylmethionine-8-amino-7-oxononanoate aminotransferase